MSSLEIIPPREDLANEARFRLTLTGNEIAAIYVLTQNLGGVASQTWRQHLDNVSSLIEAFDLFPIGYDSDYDYAQEIILEPFLQALTAPNIFDRLTQENNA